VIRWKAEFAVPSEPAQTNLEGAYRDYAMPAGSCLYKVARVLAAVIYAVALVGCSGTTSSKMISQTASSRKSAEPKPRTPIAQQSTARRRTISETTNTEKFTEAKSRAAIPLPAAPLLSPQAEPSCEFQAKDSNADERQKLDYERQCYRHSEMIVRNRLQLLQDSVDKTISAVKRNELSAP
jgi:hypothetical protein